jgi:hypothetical protein
MTFRLLLVLAVATFAFGTWQTALAARLHLARSGPRPTDVADVARAREHARLAWIAALVSAALVGLATAVGP